MLRSLLDTLADLKSTIVYFFISVSFFTSSLLISFKMNVVFYLVEIPPCCREEDYFKKCNSALLFSRNLLNYFSKYSRRRMITWNVDVLGGTLIQLRGFHQRLTSLQMTVQTLL